MSKDVYFWAVDNGYSSWGIVEADSETDAFHKVLEYYQHDIEPYAIRVSYISRADKVIPLDDVLGGVL